MTDLENGSVVSLRRCAEKRLRQRIAVLPKLSPEQIAELVRELDSHNAESLTSEELPEPSRDVSLGGAEEEMARLASFPMLNPNPIVELDLDGRVLFANPVARCLFPDLEQRGLDHPWLARSTQLVGSERLNTGAVARDVSVGARHYHQSLHCIPEIGRIRIYGMDITERVEAERALHESEERLRLHVENTPLAVVEWGKDFRVSRWSVEAERVFGWQAHEMLGKRWNELRWVHEDDKEKVALVTTQLLDGTTPRSICHNRNYRKDGSVAHCEWYNSSLLDASGNLRSILSLALDVTDRNRAEEERQQFVSLAENSHEFIGMCDMEFRPFFVNEAGMRMVGLEDMGQAFKTQVRDFFFPEDQVFIMEEFFPRVLQDGHGEVEIRFRHFKTGEPLWMMYAVFTLADANGEPSGFATVSRNISDRKRAEQRLSEMNQRLQALMEAVPVGVSFSDDPTCQSITGNPAVLSQFEVTPVDNLSASAPDATAPGRQVRFLRDGRPITDAELPLQRAVTENRVIEPMELEVHLPSGRRWFAEASGAPVRDAQGKVIGGIAVTVDITERRQAEEQLKALNQTLEQRVRERTAEAHWRASQLQQLAAQMAQGEERERRRLSQTLHDGLQQVLVAAKLRLGTTDRMVQDSKVSAAIREARNLVDEAITESRTLTRELSPPVLYDGGLAAGLEWLGHETERKYQLPVTVQVASDIEPDDVTTKVFVFQAARELVLNVVKHARASFLKMSLSRADEDRIKVVIEDDGIGFDVEAISKREGGGGFGLFSIRERVEVIGGQLMITSTPQEGTKATILAPCRLPQGPERLDVERMEYPVVPPEAWPSSTARIRVLLADDHPVLRKGLADMLMEHPDLDLVGQASDGREAIDLAIQLRPDVVLMDITMPRVDGIEATREIKRRIPATCIIGLSMHETAEMATAMRNAGAGEYLTKTAPMEDMISAILRVCQRG